MSILLLLALCVMGVVSQSLPCENNMSCRDCITDNDICVWCASDDHKDNLSRCILKSKVTDNWCPSSFLRRPEASVKEYIATDNKHAQIQPQKFKLRLLPGEAVNFTFVLSSSDLNYPVDVYFIFEGYASDNFQEIMYEINNFIGALQTSTNDISVGFGTFSHKNLDESPDCPDFKHRLNLTSDFTTLQQMVNEIPLKICHGYNGGLDALAQAIACKQFGWRQGSKKIVALVSQYTFYVAGEHGKAKNLKAYDGKCHTDAEGVYTKELEMDYPSLDMISKLATDNNVAVLFTYQEAWNHMKAFYESKLVQHNINEAEVLKIEDLKNKSFINKVNTLVTSGFTIPRVQYKENADKNVKVTFNPDCSKDAVCRVVKDRLYFINASVTLLQYEGLDNYSIDITLPAVTDKVTVDIEVIKQCECESTIGNSAHCGGETRISQP